MMDEGEARFDARDARAGLARRAGSRAVVARNDVERAIGECLPQRGLVVGLPDGWADQDRVAALPRAGVVVIRVDEIGHADFTVNCLSARLRRPNLTDALLGALMVEKQAHTG